MLTSVQLKNQIDEIETQIKTLQKEYDDTFQQLIKLPYNDSRYDTMSASLEEIRNEEYRLQDLRHELQDDYWDRRAYEREHLFVRPNSNRFYKLINKGIGKQPETHLQIQDADEKMDKISINKWLPISMIASVLLMVFSIISFLPVLALNPILLATLLLPDGMQESVVSLSKLAVVFLVIGFYLLMKGKKKAGIFLDTAALHEEQWFRQGSEHWPHWKRVTSCLSFGAAHLPMLIYPFAVNIAQVLLGGVFQWIYLREYKLTGDAEHATLFAAKLHATYNRYVFNMMSVVLLLLTVWLLISIVVQLL